MIRFTRVARLLGEAASAAGLVVPAFRSPPRQPDVERTIRRLPGGPVVAVRIEGRPFEAVVRDLVDGIVAANRLEGDAAARIRSRLTRAAAPASHCVAA